MPPERLDFFIMLKEGNTRDLPESTRSGKAARKVVEGACEYRRFLFRGSTQVWKLTWRRRGEYFA